MLQQQRFTVFLVLTSVVASHARGANLLLQGANLEELVNRAISREKALIETLHQAHPIAETYIQDLTQNGGVLKSDHYFLGRVDLSGPVRTESFLPTAPMEQQLISLLTSPVSLNFSASGFAQMASANGFDREHYEFSFAGTEYLGEVRTFVINVTPRKSAGHGRFIGRIWVEDRDCNIVRLNGTYTKANSFRFYTHFDSWRVNVGRNQWMPFAVYSEEDALPYAGGVKKRRFKAVTHFWGFTPRKALSEGEFAQMSVTIGEGSRDLADKTDVSPVESLRMFQRQSENNVINRLESANLLAPKGDVERTLETVARNLLVSNDLDTSLDIRVRVLLTTPIDCLSIGNTIIISRGLLDTLPNESALASVLCLQLAGIIKGGDSGTRFAFSDRLLFNDRTILKHLQFSRSADSEEARTEAVKMLQKSPYKESLGQAASYLKALAAESDHVPHLAKALFSSNAGEERSLTRLASMLSGSTELPANGLAALALGSRSVVDPMTDRLRLVATSALPALSNNLAFEVSPIYLRLQYVDDSQTAQNIPQPRVRENPAQSDSDVTAQGTIHTAAKP